MKEKLKKALDAVLHHPRRIIRNAHMKNKLLVAFVLLSVFPLIATGIFSVQSSSRAQKEKINAYSLQLIRQVGLNVDTKLQRIRNYSDDFIISADISNRLFGYKNVDSLEQSAIRNFFFMKLQLGFINMQHIDDVMMVFNKSEGDPPYDTTHVAMQYRWPRNEIDRVIALTKEPSNDKNFSITVADIAGTDGTGVVIGRRIGNTPTLEMLGHLLIAVRQEFFQEVYRDIAIGSGSHVFLVSSEGVLISGDIPGETIGKPLSDLALLEKIRSQSDTLNGAFDQEFAGERQLVSFSQIGSTKLYAIMTVPYAYLNTETARFTQQVVYLSIIIFLLAILAAIVISGNIASPLRRLAEHMEAFGEGTLKEKTKVDRDDEVGHLQRSFNDMTTDIEDLMGRIEKENRIRRMSELRILEYQINPHFLYNTLDSINWMAQKAGQPEIGKMVTALARFYRLGLSKGKLYYTVDEEISHVTNYLLISKFRYKDSFDFSVEVDEDVSQCYILRIILQPLAENAIKYGINKLMTTGHILIKASRQDDKLLLEVRDNGRGISPERLAYLNHALSEMRSISENEDGFGLLNVHQRIRLTYGDGYGVHLESEEGSYTSAVLTLPIKYQ